MQQRLSFVSINLKNAKQIIIPKIFFLLLYFEAYGETAEK